MSKKDYIAFAIEMATVRQTYLGYAEAMACWHDMRNAMVAIFENDNPAFDQKRFEAATEE